MRLLLFVLAALMLAACNFDVPEVTPTIAPTRPPSRTPQPSQTPSFTPSPIPTATQLPTETPTLPPTNTPIPPTFTPTFLPTATLALPTEPPTTTPQTIIMATAGPVATVPEVFPTSAVIVEGFSPSSPGSGRYTLSPDGGAVALGEFNLNFPTVLYAQNPANPNQYAVVNPTGQIFFVYDYANQRLDRVGMTNFTRFHYQITSRADNDKPITKMEWSRDGTLAMLIDGDQNLDDGVWIWSPSLGTFFQMLRECWHPAICENIMNKQGMDDWEARDLKWSPDSGAVLIEISITHEGRNAWVITERSRPDPGNVPPLNRYDYATWSLNSQFIVVSGRGPDGTVVYGRVSRDGVRTAITPISAVGFNWIQDAVEFDGKIYAFASRNGMGDALQLIDEFGTEITPPMFTNPQRISWGPGNRACLVVSGGRYYLIFLPTGEVREITGEMANAYSVEWVATPPE